LFLHTLGTHQDLHSFPTRRSSDLTPVIIGRQTETTIVENPNNIFFDKSIVNEGKSSSDVWLCGDIPFAMKLVAANADIIETWLRSEEHTSELQSRENLVCRLLLEK